MYTELCKRMSPVYTPVKLGKHIPSTYLAKNYSPAILRCWERFEIFCHKMSNMIRMLRDTLRQVFAVSQKYELKSPNTGCWIKHPEQEMYLTSVDIISIVRRYRKQTVGWVAASRSRSLGVCLHRSYAAGCNLGGCQQSQTLVCTPSALRRFSEQTTIRMLRDLSFFMQHVCPDVCSGRYLHWNGKTNHKILS